MGVKMPKFAANLSMLFIEVDFVDHFAAAAKAGFRAVECQFPDAEPAEQIAAATEAGRRDAALPRLAETLGAPLTLRLPSAVIEYL